jgi:hypothetical protein
MDHSKRVSAKENVDCLKARLRAVRNCLVAWLGTKPVRRSFRTVPILTLLGIVGVLLSIAALMIVLGIGETQIVASEYPMLHRADVWANPWFYLGFGGFMIGIVLFVFALCAATSKAKGAKEFPDLIMRVLLRADYDGVQEPGGAAGHGEVVRLAHVRLLVKNQERDRDVTLPVSLSLDTRPAVSPVPAGSPPASALVSPFGVFATTWTPAASEVPGVPGVRRLEMPVQVVAGGQVEGDIFFAIPQHWVPGLIPGQHGRVTVVDRKTDKFVVFEHGYPHDRVTQ